MAQRLTKSIVERMQPGDRLWDSDVKGFGVRCQGATPSYMLKTRVLGRQRFLSIGKHGSPWTVEMARREALRLLSAAKLGADVARERQEARKAQSMRTIAEAYLTEYGPKLRPRTLVEYRRLIDKTLIPAFGSRRLDDITKGDISRFHAGLARTPRKANFAVAVLSSLFNWAIEQGYTKAATANPCASITKFRETARERYLNREEIARLMDTLDAVDADGSASISVTNALRLLLLTGARHNEILTLRWDYVDFERGILWLPESKTGRKPIHLNPEALDILRTHPRLADNPFIITGRRRGAPLTNLQKPWDEIRHRAGFPEVRIHDLRHSFASIAINAGASLHMVGKPLGHAQPQTTARYAHLADHPLRRLNDEIGAAITTTRKGHKR